MAEEILVEYKVSVDGLKAELKTVQNEFKKTEETATKGLGETKKGLDDTVKSTASLNSQLKELKKQIALSTDPKEIERLSKAAAGVKNEIAGINKEVDKFTKSKYQNVATAFGDIGYKIKSLDFAGAAKESKKLLSAVSAISFKDVISSVKDIGATLVNVGKSLLTNPLFILAAVLVGISKAAYDVGKAMSMVDVQTQTVTDAINAQVKAIRGYSDRVAEVYIKLNEGLGRYTTVQAEVKRSEIKNNQELLANKEKYSEDLVKLATELGLDLSKLQNGAFKETYDGDIVGLQNKKRFNLEKAKLDKAYHQQNIAAVKTQLIEKLQIEVDGNLASIKKSQDFLNANREKQKADRQKETEDAIAEAERLSKLLRDLQIKGIASNYERKKATIMAQYDDQQKAEAGHTEILMQLDKNREKELLDLYNEREKEYEKIRKEGADKSVEIFKKSSDEMKAEDTSFSKTVKANQEAIIEKVKVTAEERKAIEQELYSFLSTTLSGIAQINTNIADKRIQETQEVNDAETYELQKQLDAKLITQDQYDQKKAELDKRSAEKEKEIKRRAFEANKQIMLIQTIMATAQATIAALGSIPYTPANIALAALTAASGAVQIAVITSQPTPKFAKGGKIDGRLHSQGGTLIEAERDEMIINRNDAMKNDKLLGAINSGKGQQFIFDHYIAPALKAQQQKNAENKEKSFASNLANSMGLNFKDGNLLDSMKQSRKNDKDIAIYLGKKIEGSQRSNHKW